MDHYDKRADDESSEEDPDDILGRQEAEELDIIYHGPLDVLGMTRLAWECKLQRLARQCLEFLLIHHHKVKPSLAYF